MEQWEDSPLYAWSKFYPAPSGGTWVVQYARHKPDESWTFGAYRPEPVYDTKPDA